MDPVRRSATAAVVSLAAGCQIPLLNQAPVLISVNGRDPAMAAGWQVSNAYRATVQLPTPAGDVLELDVVAEDPEGDVFEVWFPANLGTIEFDPHGTHGRWILPGPDPEGRMPPLSPLYLVLREPDDATTSTWYEITFDRR
jgi:hypothetical protein